MRRHLKDKRRDSVGEVGPSTKEVNSGSVHAESSVPHAGLTVQAAAVRDRMLEGLDGFKSIVERHGTSLMQRKFAETQDLLNGLDERAKRNDLPDPYVRMQLNDARLDALTLLSGLKVAMLYEHQRLLAPTEKMRSEIEESLEHFLGDEPVPLAQDELDIEAELARLQGDLETLAQSQKLIMAPESGQ